MEEQITDRRFAELKHQFFVDTLDRLQTGEARRLLRQIELVVGTDDRGGVLEVATALGALPSEPDREVLGDFIAKMRALHEGHIEYSEGQKFLLEMVNATFERAWELEPGAELNNVTDAIAIIEKHGEKVGFSEEVLEMELEMPIPPGEPPPEQQKQK